MNRMIARVLGVLVFAALAAFPAASAVANVSDWKFDPDVFDARLLQDWLFQDGTDYAAVFSDDKGCDAASTLVGGVLTKLETDENADSFGADALAYDSSVEKDAAKLHALRDEGYKQTEAMIDTIRDFLK